MGRVMLDQSEHLNLHFTSGAAFFTSTRCLVEVYSHTDQSILRREPRLLSSNVQMSARWSSGESCRLTGMRIGDGHQLPAESRKTSRFKCDEVQLLFNRLLFVVCTDQP